MKEITNESFEAEIAEGVTLVDFFADWCGPCRMLAPTVEEIAEEYGERIQVLKGDVDKLPEISLRLGIMSIPTLVLFKDGEIQGKLIGVCEYEEIAEMIDAAL